MSSPPFVLLRGVGPVALGLYRGHTAAYDGVQNRLFPRIDLADLDGVVSASPSACFFGVELTWAEQERRRANPLAIDLGARGDRFEAFPPGIASGFPMAEAFLQQHRRYPPSPEVVLLCVAFSVSTVQTSIAAAERGFSCFSRLYPPGGPVPDADQIRQCFLSAGTGFQNNRTHQILSVGDWGVEVIAALRGGLQDRELRRFLATQTDLPKGLSLAKLSFTLALLGQDVICLDARIKGRLFSTEAEEKEFDRATDKSGRRLRNEAIDAYEATEDSFLAGNRYYRPEDPIGRARAQWMSWESVGHKTKAGVVVTPATHEVWWTAVAERGPTRTYLRSVPREPNPIDDDRYGEHARLRALLREEGALRPSVRPDADLDERVRRGLEEEAEAANETRRRASLRGAIATVLRGLGADPVDGTALEDRVAALSDPDVPWKMRRKALSSAIERGLRQGTLLATYTLTLPPERFDESGIRAYFRGRTREYWSALYFARSPGRA